MTLAGKTAIVTGAASGIGRAVTEAFAAEGAKAWALDMAAAGLSGLANAEVVDVADAAAVDAVVAKIDAAAGGIDLLVNCAGAYALQPWLEIEAETWDRIFAVNARGVMLMTQAVARTMVARGRGGGIVNIASGAGRRGDLNSVAYSASKAAVISITQSAALGLAPHGIRVNAIAPGPVDTPMWECVVALRSGRGDQSAEQMKARVPLGRVSTPDEQARVVLFLAGDDSRYITGQTLNVDGGLFSN